MEQKHDNIRLLCEKLNYRIERTFERGVFIHSVNIEDVIRSLNEGKCKQFIMLLKYMSNDHYVYWINSVAYIRHIYMSRSVELSLYSDLIKSLNDTPKGRFMIQCMYYQLAGISESIEEVKTLINIFTSIDGVRINDDILYQLIYESNINDNLLHRCAKMLTLDLYNPQLIEESLKLLKTKLD